MDSNPKWNEVMCPNLKEMLKFTDKSKVFWWCWQPKILFGCKLWLCNLQVDDTTFNSEMHTTSYHAVTNAVDKYLNSLM